MKIAIWTKSPPKVAAMEDAIKKCPYFKWKEIEIIPLKVDSEISDMPVSMEENMIWAKNRALNSSKEVEADYYIWMEWWTSFFWDKTYLFGVVYILNNSWEGHFWISNMMEVPSVFHKRIYNNKEELWPVLQEITWIEGASKKTWAFWAWSDDLYTRKDQFEIAFLTGIAPFFNKYYKI